MTPGTAVAALMEGWSAAVSVDHRRGTSYRASGPSGHVVSVYNYAFVYEHWPSQRKGAAVHSGAGRLGWSRPHVGHWGTIISIVAAANIAC